jgi:hypothetical protein
MSSFDDLYTKILGRMTGSTTFEINARKDALNLLFFLMYNMSAFKKASAQTKYLLENDIMTDEEWSLYLDLNWNEPGLSLNKDIN